MCNTMYKIQQQQQQHQQQKTPSKILLFQVRNQCIYISKINCNRKQQKMLTEWGYNEKRGNPRSEDKGFEY